MADLKNKNNSFGWKHAIVTMAFASIAAVGGVSAYQAYKAQETQKEKIELAKQQSQADTLQTAVKNPVHDIVYHVDTLEHKSSALLYHQRGEITRNFVANQNIYRMQLSLFVHEKWHHHNHLLGYRTRYKFKPDEYYKLCLHDEITATIAALLTTRYQYMEASDKKDFLNHYKKGIYKFYYEALERGEINPYDNSPEAREKEWKLIANGTRKMWMERMYSHYKRASYSMLQTYLSIHGLVNDSKKNYNYIVGKMYTVGGVNFWSYMQEDVPVQDTRVLLTDEVRKVPSLHRGGRFVTDAVNEQMKLLGNIGYEQQQEAFQHLLISSKLKYMLRQFKKEDIERNPKLISSYYHRLLSNVYHDEKFKNLVSQAAMYTPNKTRTGTCKEEYEDVLKQLYCVQGVDLRSIIKDFNVNRVPVKQSMSFDFVSDTRWLDTHIFGLYLDDPMTAVQEAAILNKVEKTKKGKSDKSPLSPPLQQPKQANGRRKGQSEDMSITAPNFWEPILLNDSPEVMQKINDCIAKFNAIPDVEKGCDLKAQQAYRLQQEQNNIR